MSTSIAQIVKENASLERKVDKMEDLSETRAQFGTVMAAALGARIGLKLVTAFVPAIAPLIPVIEIGGAAIAAKKAFELGDDAPLALGVAVGLGIGAADRFAETALNTINKFKNK